VDAASLAAAIKMLLDHEHLTVHDADVVEAALDLFQSRPAWRFTDCLILHLASKAGHLPLGTFD